MKLQSENLREFIAEGLGTFTLVVGLQIQFNLAIICLI